jgi:integrase
VKAELNDRYLRSLKAPDVGRLEISDTKRKGLRFRLSASGKSMWMYEKRVKGGLKRKHTLGAWPAVSLADARATALEIEAEAAKGIDRVALLEERNLKDEAAQAGLSTVQQVVEIYDELHLANLRTGAERKRQLEQSLSKHLHKSISDLTRKDLQEAVDTKAKEGRKIFANRIRAALVAFANWAWERGYLQEHIGAGVAKPSKEASRDRVLTLQEVQAIYLTSHKLGPLWGPLVRLLLLTGQRRGEIIKLRWDEIDLDRARIVKAGSSTKNRKPHTTHLSAPALAELEGLACERVGYVFTTTGTTPVSGISKVKDRFDKALGEDFEPWRFHDIRTGMATALAEAGEPENVVDRILNHSASGSAPSAVARVYNQAEQLPQRAKALNKWADLVTSQSPQIIKLARI